MFYTDSPAMSARVFADIMRRGIEHKFDVLPIAANSCNYPIRFDSECYARNSH